MNARSDMLSLLAVGALVALLGTGCKAKIGDGCSLSTDCSAVGDRLCDTSQPGGYCTLFNCEPGRCPDEAVCVAFRVVADGTPKLVPTCDDPQRWARFERTFCERTCTSQSDCRDGYTCANEDALTTTWNAKIAEGDQSASVCVPTPAAKPAAAPGAQSMVCDPRPKPWKDDTIPEWDGGVAGASGAGGGAVGGAAGTTSTAGSSGAGGTAATGGSSGGASGSGAGGSAGASGTGGASGAAGASGAGGAGGM